MKIVDKLLPDKKNKRSIISRAGLLDYVYPRNKHPVYLTVKTVRLRIQFEMEQRYQHGE